jgi:hypothetical protein
MQGRTRPVTTLRSSRLVVYSVRSFTYHDSEYGLVVMNSSFAPFSPTRQLSSSPPVLAAIRGFDDILALLLRKSVDTRIMKSALFRAVTEGRDQTAAIIVDKCPDIEVLQENLHDAVQRGLVKCVNTMVKKGVSPNHLRDVSIWCI